ncbi:GDSL-type esterase/lipase family protein [Thermodesulfobacteriota bacterium]
MKPVYIAAACLLIIVIYILFPSSYEIKNKNPQNDVIVCFGDSLTYGTGTKKGMDYPSQLSRMIKREIINMGVPGNTTVDALARLDDVIEKSPGYVLITLGGNDLKNRMSKEQAFTNLESIIIRLQVNGSLVVIGGIDVPVWGRGFGKGYEELAKETGSVLVPNVYKGIIGKRDLMSDAIHPNSKGYSIMANHFYEVLEPYL